MSDVLKLMKLDGFSIKNFLGGSLSSIVDRYKNGNDYLSMKTSKVGLATSYGFAAVNFIKLGVAIGSSNYEEIAKTSRYILL